MKGGRLWTQEPEDSPSFLPPFPHTPRSHVPAPSGALLAEAE